MDAVELSKELIKFKSISPLSEGSLEYIAELLKEYNFECHLLEFGEKKVKNLFAILSSGQGPNVCFAGHTDVAPPGHISVWETDPFKPVEIGGKIFGRGAKQLKALLLHIYQQL